MSLYKAEELADTASRQARDSARKLRSVLNRIEGALQTAELIDWDWMGEVRDGYKQTINTLNEIQTLVTEALEGTQ